MSPVRFENLTAVCFYGTFQQDSIELRISRLATFEAYTPYENPHPLYQIGSLVDFEWRYVNLET